MSDRTWLIERGSSSTSAPQYYAGLSDGTRGEIVWTTDPLAALRYSKYDHAEEAASHWPLGRTAIRIAEHEFTP